MIDRLTGVYKNLNRAIVAVVFRCQPDNQPHEAATSEAAEINWMTRYEVVKAMDPAYAVRVMDAFGGMPQARVHDGVELA